MNLMLLKYCLTIVFKKRERERDEKMACQRRMTQQIKLDMKRSMFICALTWSVVNMSINLWIQSLTLQQIRVKQMTFYLIHRNSTYTIRAGEVKINAGKKLWATLRDPWKRVRPWTIFLEKFFQKSPSLAIWQDDTWSQDHSVLQQLKISW